MVENSLETVSNLLLSQTSLTTVTPMTTMTYDWSSPSIRFIQRDFSAKGLIYDGYVCVCLYRRGERQVKETR